MSNSIKQIIQDKYGQVARSGLSSQQTGVRSVAEAFGYSTDELSSIPAEANMGLSCGNPTAFAGLRPGEVVVDLGSGGGLDVFLAAKSVGPTGRAIGIDMTADMIDLARKNAARVGGGQPPANIEFHLATIDQLPLPDASVDCIVSNCVINLAPDKTKVFAEMARVLKPGGRLAISDIAIKKRLPDDLSKNLMAYVGCIAGAIQIDEYRAGLLAAGFSAVETQDSGADLNAYGNVEGQSACCTPDMTPIAATPTTTGGLEVLASCCGSSGGAEKTATDSTKKSGGSCCGGTGDSSIAATTSVASSIHADLQDLLTRYDVNEFAASVKVLAVKGAAVKGTAVKGMGHAE
ncbi:MAG: arsenite methyltransferase [Planctomycetota bacterium]|nr:arsenite methyltransferase [Planctomycetota bacterium]